MAPHRGFTLAEVLVALVLLAVGLLTLAGETGRLVRQLGRADRSRRVSEAAARRMERLRAEGCVARVAGAEEVGFGGKGGGASLATLAWEWSTIADSAYAARLVTVPVPEAALVPSFGRPSTLLTAVDCRR